MSFDAGSNIDRRTLFKLAGSAALIAGISPAISSCGAAAAFVAENPATWEWLATLASSVAASVISNALDSAYDGVFKSWETGTKNQESNVYDTYPWYSYGLYGVTSAPAVLVEVNKTKDGNPLTDGLLVVMQGGHSAVLLPSWAWQGLSMFIGEQLNGKQGDDLA